MSKNKVFPLFTKPQKIVFKTQEEITKENKIKREKVLKQFDHKKKEN